MSPIALSPIERQAGPKRALRWWFACALLLAGTAGCRPTVTLNEPSSGTAPPRVKIEVVQVKPGEVGRTVEVPGTIQGDEQARLFARTEGYVARVDVDLGDEVSKGQILAELDVPGLRAEVERRRQLLIKAEADLRSREAEVEQARAKSAEQEALLSLRQAEFDRIDNLVRGGAINKEKRDEARFAIDAVEAAMQSCQADIQTSTAHVAGAQAAVGVAQAELDKSETMTSFAEIRAPFAGLITSRMVDPGALVRPAGSDDDAGLFEIVSFHKVRVIVFLSMEDAAQLDNGDEATVFGLQGRPGVEFRGTISRYARAFQQGSRMMRAEIDLENPVDPRIGKPPLQPGDYGKVRLTLQKISGIPVVPASAVAVENNESYVMVVDDGYQCRRRPVKIAVQNGDLVGLEEGIQTGERVVARDLGRLKDEQQLSADAVQLVEFEVK